MFTSSAIRRALSHPQHCRNVIKAENGRVNAIVFTSPEPKSSKKGPLSDMSIAVKDNICTADMPTSCASEMLRGFTSPFDATVVSLLDEAGADIVGKANCDEFAMGSLNIHSAHGPVVNPFRPASSLTTEFPRSAGGSSGGSAAAVAAGMCDAALGTDTGGSVRLPASYCGVAGLKPSYGIISRWGVVAYADSLDCVGILGKRVNGVKRVFDTISKYDARDPTAALPDVRARTFAECASQMEQHWSFLHKRTTSLRGLRIGIPQEYFPSELPPALLEPLRLALQRLKARDATVIPVSLPSTRSALAAYYVIASAEASSNLARYDGVRFGVRNDFVEGEGEGEGKRDARSVYARTREAGFGKELRCMLIPEMTSAFENYFLQAQRVRNLVRKDFRTVFRSGCVLARERGLEPAVDVLLHPSTIRTAPPLHTSSKTTNTSTSSTTNEDPGLRLKRLDAYVQDVLTVPASLAGLPALSVPAGLAADGWPVGISVVGNWGADQAVLHVGEILEGLGGS